VSDVPAYGPGTLAYLDSLHGLVPCKVTAVDEARITVDFDDAEKTLHWAGGESNAWRGQKGEQFPPLMVVPRKSVRWPTRPTDPNPTIRPYRWVP
jgi:hypothetical protein